MALPVNIGILAGNGDNLVATSAEELAKKAEHVQKLREQVAEAEAKRVAREVEASNDVAYAQLDAEEARLEAQLAAAKESAKVGVVKEGLHSVVQPVKDDYDSAQALAKAQAEARQGEGK